METRELLKIPPGVEPGVLVALIAKLGYPLIILVDETMEQRKGKRIKANVEVAFEETRHHMTVEIQRR